MLAIRLINPTAARGLIEYLTEQVATATDHGVSPMTRYFKSAGQPPGRWLGQGLAGMSMVEDWTVSAAGLERLFQEGTHPRTGATLTAHSYVPHESLAERVATEVAKLPADMTTDERQAAEAAIVAEQKARKVRASVSGFELVFSPPKSFSVAWGLADVALKEQLVAAHDAALAETMEIMEERYLRTRVGTNGVAQVATRGAVAARFDHWNSRALDPHLHTHVLVANRVQGLDGRWRTIDSRGALLPAAVTLSETYTGLLMDRVTERLGWEWANTTPTAAAKNAKWELAGVPRELIAAFSQRSARIQADVDELLIQFRVDHGREPTASELLRLRERARRDSAPEKKVLSLQQLSADWGRRAAALGVDGSWLDRMRQAGAAALGTLPRALRRADDVHPKRIEWIVNGALQALGERSTWRRHNVAAEAQRLLRDVRFRTARSRQQLVDLIVEEVIAQAVPLTPPAQLSTPVRFRTPDGRSAFAPALGDVFTTAEVIAAEERLLAALDASSRCPAALVDTTALTQMELDAGQVAAIVEIATSRRTVDVLVGPAGTGKTTTLRQLHAVWTGQHGADSVIGLAPSAAAAAVLGESLGVPTENTAKWLLEHDRGTDGYRLHAGQLVIVDEAGLAGTLALDRLREAATAAGAKLLLVGDPLQLGAVDAGGALDLLVAELGEAAPTLNQAWRFKAPWEAAASLELRVGRPDVLDIYDTHQRLHDGDRDSMLDGAFAAWAADETAGLTSILVADTAETMNELNARAQALMLDRGRVDHSTTVAVTGGLTAGRGDRVITRVNDRGLRTASGGFVRNGESWSIEAVFDDGSLALVDDMGDSVVVDAQYAADSIDLGYAITVHRAQGSTVDTAHVVVTEHTAREALYVGMTRGRLANHAWAIVAADTADSDDPTWQAPMTGRELLEHVLARRGGQRAAHTIRRELHTAATSIQQLAAEYETISAAAGAELWHQRLRELGISSTLVDQMTGSTAWPSMVALLRRCDAEQLPIEAHLPALVAERGFADAADPASVLHYRLGKWMHSTAPEPQPVERIVGLVARTTTTDLPAEVIDALDEREAAMTARAAQLVDEALATEGTWLGPRTSLDPHEREAALTVAAYRDRHGVPDTERRPLGGSIPSGSTARSEWARAKAAWEVLSPTSRAVTRPLAEPLTPGPSATVHLER